MSTLYFIVAMAAAFGLGGLLVWAFRGASDRSGHQLQTRPLEGNPQHLCNMAQMRQAMNAADLQFVRAKGGTALFSRVRRERREALLLYLFAIRREFQHSLRLARIIAVLSPEVSGSHEYERLRLSIVFHLRFQLVKLALHMGNVELPQVTNLGEMATSLAVQMEQAMASLGERAALAAELALQSDR